MEGLVVKKEFYIYFICKPFSDCVACKKPGEFFDKARFPNLLYIGKAKKGSDRENEVDKEGEAHGDIPRFKECKRCCSNTTFTSGGKRYPGMKTSSGEYVGECEDGVLYYTESDVFKVEIADIEYFDPVCNRDHRKNKSPEQIQSGIDAVKRESKTWILS
jgi:hypothetical protein